MRGAERRDAVVLMLAAGALLSITVVTHLGRWLAAVAELARSPLVPVLAGSALVGLVALLLVRLVVVRRALRHRVRFLLLPADSFDPADEAVARFAAGLVRSRRLLAGIFDAPASAVRVQLDTDDADRLRYVVELPAHARAALRTAASAFGGVELREVDPPAGSWLGSRASVARAELVLSRPSVEPLRAAALDPDPLAGFARALSSLRRDLGDDGRVCVDLLPLTPAQRRRLRGRMLRAARREHHDADVLADVLDLAAGGARGRAAPAELVERRAGQRALTSKLGSPEPLFTIQVLLRTSSSTAGQAKQTITALLSAFDAWDGENHFRVSGLRLPGGAVFLGADMPWRRRRFDRRMRTGLFRPARRRVVTATEISGLLKPPTTHCAAPNVLRSGGVIPPPPPGLPTFHGQRELLPLGTIATEDGERTVGVPVEGTFFSYMAGRSRYGKTETALGQFVHLARTGHGCFFLDPHADAIERVKRYIAREGLRERVVEINLAGHGETQLGWNLLATHGRPAHTRVDAVVDAFASAMRWDETNTRALALTTHATKALVDLAGRLPAELAPTIFQIPTLLGDDDWRAAVLPHVSPATREFFVQRFPRLSSEAITPVTNLIDRLRLAPSVAALFGSPTSSYDVRAAMDRGAIVLACPGYGSTRDRLTANFMAFDLLHGAKTRAELAPERRRPFFAFFDEIQTFDGASSGTLAALLEQVAKYGVRCFLFNQNPERLTSATWNAISTNRSHLATTTLNARGAALLARELGAVEPTVITRLARYTYVSSVTLAGEASPPFLIHGVPLEDLYPETPDDPDELAALEATIDRTVKRQPVAATLRVLDEHDQRSRDYVRRRPRERRAPSGPYVPGAS
jgi:hypothetical protein